jgi:glycosyltransferase involved in cell wall biosynthesis
LINYDSSPKVSVVIPVFNGERFIGDAIQSALDQTFRDFEIIVVDDGSTDRTERIVRQFSGSISYHRQENRGAGAARNLGAALTKGEWIAFLDADDVWCPQKLSIQMDATSTNPEVSFVYCDMDVIDMDGVVIQTGFLGAKLARRKRKNRWNLVSLAFNGQPFPYPSTVLLKRELFMKAGGFSPLFRRNYHEDFDLFARVAGFTPLYFIPQRLVKYRKVPRTPIGENPSEENWPVLLRRLADLWRDDANRLKVVDWLLVKHSSDRGKRFMRSGDWVRARECFRSAFRQRPFYWKNLRRWGLSYLPGAREFYVIRKGKRVVTWSGEG